MRVGQIYTCPYITTNNYDKNKYCHAQFKSSKIKDGITHTEKNPLVRYLNNLFKKSLSASTMRILPICADLKPITKEVAIQSKKNESTYAWDIENKFSNKYILYLHGAAQNITNVQPLYRAIIENTDFSILALEYRGFGKNETKDVSAQTFLEDTTAAIEYLEKQKGIKEKNIFIIGHSMGAYPAAQLAATSNNFGRLVLIAPLISIANQPLDLNLWFKKRMSPFLQFLFKNFKFLRKPLASFFNAEQFIKKTQVPVDIIHSLNDRFLNHKMSEQLAIMCNNLHSLSILPTGGHKMEQSKINAIISILSSQR